MNSRKLAPAPRRALGGLLDQKERWSLSPRGWLILLSLLFGLGTALFFQVQPFLAVTDKVSADILVVEGWIPDYAIKAAAAEFRTGSYQRVYTTGGPVVGSGTHASDSKTAAYLGATRLKDAGVSENVIQRVPSLTRDRDRTYSSAIALRDWLRDQDLSVRGLNVVTVGVHARRTQLLYQMAFGDSVMVGIISVPDDDYPAARWWRYSNGVRNVISETIAYLYARVFFSHSGKSGMASISPKRNLHSFIIQSCMGAATTTPLQNTLLQVQGAIA